MHLHLVPKLFVYKIYLKLQNNTKYKFISQISIEEFKNNKLKFMDMNRVHLEVYLKYDMCNFNITLNMCSLLIQVTEYNPFIRKNFKYNYNQIPSDTVTSKHNK